MTWDELQAHYARVRAELDQGLFGSGPLAGTDVGPGCTLPWFNQAPGQPSPVVLLDAGALTYRRMRWGFPPTWVARSGKDPWKERPLVNAKGEEAREKRTWSKPLAEGRCVVPNTGFYEWWRRGKERFPLHFAPASGGIASFAGIWRHFSRGEEQVACFAILTSVPSEDMAGVHDRMPVILADDDLGAWLDPRASDEAIDALMRPAPAGTLRPVEAHTALNSWRASGAEVLEADWTWQERP
ncbi:MAG: SOS response-associated peptidase [Alphaproteobacteria bacterium]|nr:SOS response-associated peptidase [Alphaproteobacteria bacterium]